MFPKPLEGGLSSDGVDFENEYYRTAKKDIQKFVCAHTSWTQRWQMEVPPMSDLSHLKDRLTNKGFVMKQITDESNSKSYWDNTKPKMVLNVSLPDKPQKEEEDGYFSDDGGKWDAEFSAAKIKEKMDKNLSEDYQSLMKLINEKLDSHRLTHKFILRTKSIHSPYVILWVEEEFKAKRWEIAVESHKGLPRKPSHCEYSHTFTCTNPAVKNEIEYKSEI